MECASMEVAWVVSAAVGAEKGAAMGAVTRAGEIVAEGATVAERAAAAKVEAAQAAMREAHA